MWTLEVLFTSLSTQQNLSDRSLGGDALSISFEFQVGKVDKTSWSPGKTNLSDALTKMESSLTDA